MFEAVIVMEHQEHIVVWLQTHDMAGFKLCIYMNAADRKWLPTGLCRSSSSSLFSILNGFFIRFESHAAKQSTSRSHCTLFLIPMKR